MPSLKFRVLGTPRIEYAGQPVVLGSQKALALLLYLAIEGNRPLSRETLAAMLWEESDDHHARRSLNDALYKLRRSLPDSDHVTATADSLQLAQHSDCWVDAHELERALAALSAEPDPVSVSRAIQAVDLYRGEFLEGFLVADSESYASWIMRKRYDLHRCLVTLLEHLASYYWQTRQYQRATEYSHRVLRVDPLRESAHRMLMRLNYRKGDVASALQTYEACRRQLHTDLGVEPSQKTQDLAAQIAAGIALPTTEGVSAPLLQRRTADRPPFVNREAHLDTLDSRLRSLAGGHAAVVLIEGEAGIGKTRLIEEFARGRVDTDVTALFASCDSSETPVPGLPFAPLFRQALSEQRSLSGPRSEASSPHLERLLAQWEQSASDRAAGHDDTAHRLATLFLPVLRDIARRRSLLLVLDDYQWSDMATRDLLGYFARTLNHEQVLFVIAYRSDELTQQAELALDRLATKHRAARIALGRLSQEEAGQLVRAMSRGIGGRAIEKRIYERSRGNPLFVIELTHSLFHPASHTPADEPLPHSMRPLVRSRVSRLAPSALKFLYTAAVAGDYSSFGTIQRAAGLEQSDALIALDTLVRMHLLEERSPGELRFAYRGVRQIALEGMSSTHIEALRQRLARVRPTSYRSRFEQARTRLLSQLRPFQRPRDVLKHVIREVMRFLGTCLVCSLVAFLALRAFPGGPFRSPPDLPPATLDALSDYYALAEPPVQQYLHYLSRLGAHLDLGPSYVSDESVSQVLLRYLPTTGALWLWASLIAVTLGIALGLLSSVDDSAPFGHLSRGVVRLGLTAPPTVLGPLLFWACSVGLAKTPIGPSPRPSYVALAAITLGFGNASLVARAIANARRQTRIACLARPKLAQQNRKGGPSLRALLLASLGPLLRITRPMCSHMMAHSLAVEVFFDVPGMGSCLLGAMRAGDYPLFTNALLLYSFLLAAIRLLIGVARPLLAWLAPSDPEPSSSNRMLSRSQA